MSVVGLDHVSFPTAHPEELIAFYKRLGFAILHEEEWRAGKAPVISVQLGSSKLNIHSPEFAADPTFTLRGPTATPGCGDFCVVWEGGPDAAVALLREAGAEIVAGPSPRIGGRGTRAMSVYTRDPEGNLVEFLSYDE
jgi:catechol 2,3-dioxygenase-like lactoylglutathione lyase family enzyme